MRRIIVNTDKGPKWFVINNNATLEETDMFIKHDYGRNVTWRYATDQEWQEAEAILRGQEKAINHPSTKTIQ